MGNTSFKAEKQGIILGGSRSGKTTLFNNLVIKRYLKEGEINETFGYNYEILNVGDTNIGFWDVGGRDLMCNLWKDIYSAIELDFMIFVIKYDEKLLRA